MSSEAPPLPDGPRCRYGIMGRVRFMLDPKWWNVVLVGISTVSSRKKSYVCFFELCISYLVKTDFNLTMSSTTTTTTLAANKPITRTTSTVLSDYDIHHSESSSTPTAAELNTHHDSPAWDTTHRRVPSYRPINRDPAHAQGVRVYNNPIERTFITVMFSGVFINAVSLLTS